MKFASISDTRPRHNEPPVWLHPHAAAKPAALPIQNLSHPIDVVARWTDQLEAPDLQRHHFKVRQVGAGRIESGEVHRHEVVAEFLVSADAFVVVQEVAAAV